MTQPRPESRLNELESQMATHGARIRELSDDTAESLRDLRQTIQINFSEVKQDLKQLSQNKTDWQEVDAGLKLVATKDDIADLKTTMATKEDLASVKDEIAELKGLIKQLLQQKGK